MIKIKIAKHSDLKEFAKLRFLAHQYSARFDKEAIITKNTRAELTRLVEKEFEDPRIVYLLAREDKKAVGIAILALSGDIDRSAFLGELFIEEKHRRRGIGKQLVDKARRIAGKRGLKKFRVSVVRNNKLAQKFYSHLKFHPRKRDYILLEKKTAL